MSLDLWHKSLINTLCKSARMVIASQWKTLSNLSLSTWYANVWQAALMDELTEQVHSFRQGSYTSHFYGMWNQFISYINVNAHAPFPPSKKKNPLIDELMTSFILISSPLFLPCLMLLFARLLLLRRTSSPCIICCIMKVFFKKSILFKSSLLPLYRKLLPCHHHMLFFRHSLG